jgi:hypothetical protein
MKSRPQPNNGMHPTRTSENAIRKVEGLCSFVRAGEIVCSLSSVFCLLRPLRVERLTRLEHPVGEVHKFAHRRPDHRHLALASGP